ncbi:hypothetical protein HDK90DRAFT_467455 [Phyllosticta capitalensis]|uniref:Uncharacterized protein n=1 Tax=Phyllosticta capitalensis TaxID=121624 RepID=A0ABR1YKK2_9PEZI
MASTLPDELIIMIARLLLIEPDQYVVVGQTTHTRPAYRGGRERRCHFGITSFDYTETVVSPVTLSLFSPVLLSEYVKLLHSKAIFWFAEPSDLYAYLFRPDLDNSVRATRQDMRFLRINLYSPEYCEDHRSLESAIQSLPKVVTVHIDYWGLGRSPSTCSLAYPQRWNHPALPGVITALRPLIERSNSLNTVLSIGSGAFGSSLGGSDGFMEEFSVLAGRLRRGWVDNGRRAYDQPPDVCATQPQPQPQPPHPQATRRRLARGKVLMRSFARQAKKGFHF